MAIQQITWLAWLSFIRFNYFLHLCCFRRGQPSAHTIPPAPHLLTHNTQDSLTQLPWHPLCQFFTAQGVHCLPLTWAKLTWVTPFTHSPLVFLELDWSFWETLISQTDNILSSYKQFFTSLDFGSQDLITRQMLDAVVPGTGNAQWSYPSLTEIIIVAEVLENCSKS